MLKAQVYVVVGLAPARTLIFHNREKICIARRNTGIIYTGGGDILSKPVLSKDILFA